MDFVCYQITNKKRLCSLRRTASSIWVSGWSQSPLQSCFLPSARIRHITCKRHPHTAARLPTKILDDTDTELKGQGWRSASYICKVFRNRTFLAVDSFCTNAQQSIYFYTDPPSLGDTKRANQWQLHGTLMRRKP